MEHAVSAAWQSVSPGIPEQPVSIASAVSHIFSQSTRTFRSIAPTPDQQQKQRFHSHPRAVLPLPDRKSLSPPGSRRGFSPRHQTEAPAFVPEFPHHGSFKVPHHRIGQSPEEYPPRTRPPAAGGSDLSSRTHCSGLPGAERWWPGPYSQNRFQRQSQAVHLILKKAPVPAAHSPFTAYSSTCSRPSPVRKQEVWAPISRIL